VASRFLDRYRSLRHTAWFFRHFSGLPFTYRDNALLQAYIENPETFDYFHYAHPLPQLALRYHIDQDHSIFDNLLSRPLLHPTIRELKELCNIQTIPELLRVQYCLRATLDEANDYLSSVGPLQGHGLLEDLPTFAFVYPRFRHPRLYLIFDYEYFFERLDYELLEIDNGIWDDEKYTDWSDDEDGLELEYP